MIRQVKAYRPGDTIFFRVECRDETDPKRPRHTPARNPRIRLRAPSGTVELDYAEMSLESTGVFTYAHQTAIDDQTGVWKVDFKVVNETKILRTVTVDGFELSLGGGRLGRTVRRFRKGTSIYVRIEVRDEVVDTRPLHDPENLPQISIRDCEGVLRVDHQDMTRESLGTYSYTYLTQVDDPIGVWQVDFRILDEETGVIVEDDEVYQTLTIPVDIWEIVPGDVIHSDSAHSDTAHADSHSDVAHSDSAHSDSAHGDSAHTDTHSDVAHSDVSHTDSHSDTAHSDTAHTDTHSDTAHTDTHSDVAHSDAPNKAHTDSPHTDTHSDSAHADSHSDVAHSDSHSDSHSDVAHTDTAHTDTHSDVAHSDGHSDSGHSDVAHTDSHSDTAHTDSTHSDQIVFP